MKLITIILVVIMPLSGICQTSRGVAGGTIQTGDLILNKNNTVYMPAVITPAWGSPFLQKPNIEIISKYDTLELFKGVDTVKHEHDFASKDIRTRIGVCCVLHDAAGCFDTWLHEDLICTICLKNLEVKEDRSVKQIKVIDKYQEAKERLNKLKK